MTIVELIKDFIDTGKERLKTPISGAFLWCFIIFNWRPILFLLFSDASIENKIIVINYEYCTIGALGWPLLLAMTYTLGLPRLMLVIDKNLSKTKDDRVTTRYQAREHLLEQKKKVAKVEFELKNVESGSQTIDELNAQIDGLKESNKTLQESIKQINESNKINTDGLTSSLKAAHDQLNEELARKAIENLRSDNAPDVTTREISPETIAVRNYFKVLAENTKMPNGIRLRVLKTANTLTQPEFALVRDIEIQDNRVILKSTDDLQIIESLLSKKVLDQQLETKGVTYGFTENGIIIRNILRNNYHDKKDK